MQDKEYIRQVRTMLPYCSLGYLGWLRMWIDWVEVSTLFQQGCLLEYGCLTVGKLFHGRFTMPNKMVCTWALYICITRITKTLKINFLYFWTIFGHSIITQKYLKRDNKKCFCKKRKCQTSFQSAMFRIKILKAPLDKCQLVMEYTVGFIIYNP